MSMEEDQVLSAFVARAKREARYVDSASGALLRAPEGRREDAAQIAALLFDGLRYRAT